MPLSLVRSDRNPDLVRPDGVIRRWMLERRKVCCCPLLLDLALLPASGVLLGTAAGNAADPVLLSVLDEEPDTAADSDASAAGIASSCPQTSSVGPPAFAGLSRVENLNPARFWIGHPDIQTVQPDCSPVEPKDGVVQHA